MGKEHFEILLEDINEKVGLILEGQSLLNNKIDRVHQDLGEKMEFLDAKIDSVNTKLNAKIESVHDRLNAKIESVNTRLSARIDDVEKTLSDKIDVVAANLAAHRADTESHSKGYKVSDGK